MKHRFMGIESRYDVCDQTSGKDCRPLIPPGIGGGVPAMRVFQVKARAIVVQISAGVMAALWASSSSAMCIQDLGKNDLGSQVLRNTCSQYVNLRWRDQGTCNSGCMEFFGPNGSSHVVVGMSGRVRANECYGRSCTPPDSGYP